MIPVQQRICQYTADGTAGIVDGELTLVATITGDAGIIDNLAEANFAFS